MRLTRLLPSHQDRRPPRVRAERLRVEALEDRLVMAFVATGPEFRVNPPDVNQDSTQNRVPAVATDPDGDFVVAWQNGFGFEYDVLVQRYNAAGAPQGDAFRANTTLPDVQKEPAVAIDPTGDIVVAWQSYGQDGSSYGIFARRFSAAGAPLTGEIPVNTTTAGIQDDPDVAIDGGGGFVVTWNNGVGAASDIFARRFDAAGMPRGGEFRVNTTTVGGQTASRVATDAAGNFVVVWEDSSGVLDPNAAGIVAQRFSAAGAPIGGEFRVNTDGLGNESSPDVARNAQGAFVISWEERSLATGGVLIQRFDASGIALGGAFRANDVVNGTQFSSTVGIDSVGNVLVAWTATPDDVAAGSGSGIFARRLGPEGPLSGEFRVNTTTANNQKLPALAVDSTGDAVVVWENQPESGSGQGYDIYAQRFLATGPVVTTSTGALAYLEGQPAIPIDPELTITDANSPNVVGATVAITGNFAGTQDILRFSDQGGITGSYNPATGVLTLTGTAPIASYQAALRSVTYLNTSADPSTAPRTVTFTVDDGTGVGTSSAIRTIAVTAINNAPTLNPIPDVTLLEDAGPRTIALTGIGTGGEAGQALTVTATSDNPGLILNPTVTYTRPGATGTLSFTPAPDASGTATITVTVTDTGDTANGGVNLTTRTVTVTVLPVNDAPTLGPIASPVSILEDAGPRTIALTGIGTGGGEAGQALTVTAVSDNPGLIPNPTVTYTSPNATGTLSFTPAPNASGTATITVTVADAGGTANGGVNLTTRTVTVTVLPVNDAPSFTGGPDQSVAANSGPRTVPGWATNISAGAGEAGQTLTFLVTADNPALFATPPAITPDGTLTFTPAPGASGTATVTVRLRDNGGTANGGVDTSPPQTFTITVTSPGSGTPAPTLTLDPASDRGLSSTDRVTNDNTPTFIGRATPGARVQIIAQRIDQAAPAVVSQATADASG
ncbi:MAG TPA: Ig-like domain-containing protein, partial [Isosphaeraceae bacterium]